MGPVCPEATSEIIWPRLYTQKFGWITGPQNASWQAHTRIHGGEPEVLSGSWKPYCAQIMVTALWAPVCGAEQCYRLYRSRWCCLCSVEVKDQREGGRVGPPPALLSAPPNLPPPQHKTHTTFSAHTLELYLNNQISSMFSLINRNRFVTKS